MPQPARYYRQSWRDLCVQASTVQDPDKLAELLLELLRSFGEHQQSLREDFVSTRLKSLSKSQAA